MSASSAQRLHQLERGRLRPALAMLLVLGTGGAGAADLALRCGTNLIRPGDSKFYVLHQCGEPLYREVLSGGEGAESPVVEQWVYELGTQHFMRVLTFDGARLVRVESGGYPGR